VFLVDEFMLWGGICFKQVLLDLEIGKRAKLLPGCQQQSLVRHPALQRQLAGNTAAQTPIDHRVWTTKYTTTHAAWYRLFSV